MRKSVSLREQLSWPTFGPAPEGNAARESVSLREQLFQLILMNDHVVSCVKKLTGLIGSTGSFAIISLLVSSPIASVL